jgi:integrase
LKGNYQEMPKNSSYSIVEKPNRTTGKAEIWVRFFYYDNNTGKRKEKMRRADDRTQAKRIAKDLEREHDDHGSASLDAHGITFAQLAKHCEQNYFVEAEYDAEGTKTRGIRGRASTLGMVKPLVEFFGHMKLRDITAAHLMAYRTARLKTTTKRKTTRSIATVNRELSKMRTMLNIASIPDWIIKNPFDKVKAGTVISVADERQRETILTPAEEERLLAACDTDRRKHLRALVIAALDTGARQGELLNLRWHDVDFENRTLHVTSYKGKTVQRRGLPITNRLLTVLEGLKNKKPCAAFRRIRKTNQTMDDSLVFGISDNVKWAWQGARKDAKLGNLRFHDLRHTAATRLAASMEAFEVGRILGHSNPQTTYRYVNRTPDMIRRAGEAFESFSAQASQKGEDVQVSELVN